MCLEDILHKDHAIGFSKYMIQQNALSQSLIPAAQKNTIFDLVLSMSNLEKDQMLNLQELQH